MILERYIAWFVFALITGVVCYFIAKRKGRDATLWFIAGAIFSIFGIIILAKLKNLKERKVPHGAK